MKKVIDTSRESYRHCLETGVISKREAEVLQVLFDAGKPMNMAQVHAQIQSETKNPNLGLPSITPRFASLEAVGVIRKVSKNSCPISGRKTWFYEPTGAKPEKRVKAQPKRTHASTLEKEIAELRKENEQLKELLGYRQQAMNNRQERAKAPTVVQTEMQLS